MEDPVRQFEAFRPIFKDHHYISMLGTTEHARTGFGIVKRLIAAGSNLDDQIVAMLECPNWRSQIVAAAALIMGELRSPALLEALWSAMDVGSWVSPQLVVAASLVDPDFVERAHERIGRRCVLQSDLLSKTPWNVRHSSQGPTSVVGHSAKLCNALIALLNDLGIDAQWLDVECQQADLNALLEKDRDRGHEIARSWRDGLPKLIATL